MTVTKVELEKDNFFFSKKLRLECNVGGKSNKKGKTDLVEKKKGIWTFGAAEAKFVGYTDNSSKPDMNCRIADEDGTTVGIVDATLLKTGESEISFF